jgi:hypothetical protein
VNIFRPQLAKMPNERTYLGCWASLTILRSNEHYALPGGTVFHVGTEAMERKEDTVLGQSSPRTLEPNLAVCGCQILDMCLERRELLRGEIPLSLPDASEPRRSIKSHSETSGEQRISGVFLERPQSLETLAVVEDSILLEGGRPFLVRAYGF